MTRPGGGNAKKHVNVSLLYAQRPEIYGLGTTSLVRGENVLALFTDTSLQSIRQSFYNACA